MPPSSAKNGLAESRAFIIARRPEFFVVAWDRAVCFSGAQLCPIVSAVLARGLCVEIPLFFYAAEIAAARMLLFFRKSEAMDILTKRGSADSGLTGRFIGRILVKPKSAQLVNSAPGST